MFVGGFAGIVATIHVVADGVTASVSIKNPSSLYSHSLYLWESSEMAVDLLGVTSLSLASKAWRGC